MQISRIPEYIQISSALSDANWSIDNVNAKRAQYLKFLKQNIHPLYIPAKFIYTTYHHKHNVIVPVRMGGDYGVRLSRRYVAR
jgi:hypothetical protein